MYKKNPRLMTCIEKKYFIGIESVLFSVSHQIQYLWVEIFCLQILFLVPYS